jgi:hypothetical protein
VPIGRIRELRAVVRPQTTSPRPFGRTYETDRYPVPGLVATDGSKPPVSPLTQFCVQDSALCPAFEASMLDHLLINIKHRG